MKKICLFLLTSLAFFVFLSGLAISKPQNAFADPAIPVIAVTPAPDGTNVPDADVNFAGKTAARAASFVDWNLQNYAWASNDSYLVSYWVKVRNIIFVMMLVVIISASFVVIISHGTNLSILRFITRFILIIILITFSFALLQLVYQLTDVVQGFFTHNPAGANISVADLLKPPLYSTQGMRKAGMDFDESAFITINLTKITAITYYVMGGILLIRKVILWFFLIISPIFPLLILYTPLRNTAKIWIGELLRWLLYAPLFMLFLSGLIVLWQSKIGVLPFDFITDPAKLKVITYPKDSTSIYLAGPGVNAAVNSINNNNTFIQYVVALIMLWAVILLPFLLLRIFLDYVITLSIEDEHFSYIKGKLSWVNNVVRGNVSQTTSQQTQVVGQRPVPTGGLRQRITSIVKDPGVILGRSVFNPSPVSPNYESPSAQFSDSQKSQSFGNGGSEVKVRGEQLKSVPTIRIHQDNIGEKSHSPENVLTRPLKISKHEIKEDDSHHIVAPNSTPSYTVSIPTEAKREQANPLEKIEINKNTTSTSVSDISGKVNISTAKIHGVAGDENQASQIEDSNADQASPQENVATAPTNSELEEKSGMHENTADII